MDQMKAAFGKWAAPPSAPPPIPNSIPEVVKRLRTNAHYKALIVGQRGDNFPQEYRRHEQIVLWDSDKQLVAENIPKAVRLVLMTRFNNHPAMSAIRRECKARDPEILCPVKLYGTGEIKAILAPLVPVDGAAPELAKAVEPMKLPAPKIVAHGPRTLKRFVLGELTAFIARHGDDACPAGAEAERLTALAAAHGYGTTAGSVRQALYQLRKRVGTVKPRAAKAVAAVEPVQATAAPAPVVQAPKATVPKAAASISALSEDDQEVLRMLDDSAKKLAAMAHELSEIAAGQDLIRQEVVARADKRRKLKELLAGL